MTPNQQLDHNAPTRRAAPDDGASLVEYALLVALIAIVCFAAVTYFGTQTKEQFSTTAISIATN